jgi:hydroxymethylbilane synthase
LPAAHLILASRRSQLAVQQSGWVKAELERRLPSCRVEILPVVTAGDRNRSRPLPEIGGKGLFTQELQEALLSGRAHFAVHSLKDLPTDAVDGLVLAAIPVREDPRDVLISSHNQKLDELVSGARVGTSSVRRAAQLRRLRPDLRIEPLRGNLGTRLRKLKSGALDAIVLAAAGLHRMGWSDQITEYFPFSALCPAVGQGALAIEAPGSDAAVLAQLAVLEDSPARLGTTAERSVLRNLGGGCQVPIAAHSRHQGNQLDLTALVIRPDGSDCVTVTESAPVETIAAAEDLGRRVADELLRQGAGPILEAAASALPGASPLPETP